MAFIKKARCMAMGLLKLRFRRSRNATACFARTPSRRITTLFRSQGEGATLCPVSRACAGRSTHSFREVHGIPKDRNTDAYCIVCSILEEPKYVAAPKDAFEILQYRRHDRALTKAEHGRYYYLPQKNGKLLKVAVHRKKACSVDQLTGKETKQASDSLEDWFNKMVGKVGKEEAMRLRSSLVVKKSTRVKNNMGRHLPGAIFSYNNTNYVLRANHGDYVNAVGSDKESPP